MRAAGFEHRLGLQHDHAITVLVGQTPEQGLFSSLHKNAGADTPESGECSYYWPQGPLALRLSLLRSGVPFWASRFAAGAVRPRAKAPRRRLRASPPRVARGTRCAAAHVARSWSKRTATESITAMVVGRRARARLAPASWSVLYAALFLQTWEGTFLVVSCGAHTGPYLLKEPTDD